MKKFMVIVFKLFSIFFSFGVVTILLDERIEFFSMDTVRVLLNSSLFLFQLAIIGALVEWYSKDVYREYKKKNKKNDK